MLSEFFGISTVIAKTAAKSNPANNKISEIVGSPYSLKIKLKTIINPERMVTKTKPAIDCLTIIKPHLNNDKCEIYNTKD